MRQLIDHCSKVLEIEDQSQIKKELTEPVVSVIAYPRGQKSRELLGVRAPCPDQVTAWVDLERYACE
jgi:hypothetical protein